ncbi:hypothetical protein CAPTEDRAFT_189901 [Capitella teleta]|uniref:Uncharacterized protein n=1 Tax=Capitella teleta TaxID=283909 RepID=R7TRY3_CAPTE|nr:hypothetical protein CAPTEDRAFT_189901 [Capitella teleta]|eukprot:ELT96327.1 hypothetical protein CAPTEDRAFT_189901 [Capitella teleta]
MSGSHASYYIQLLIIFNYQGRLGDNTVHETEKLRLPGSAVVDRTQTRLLQWPAGADDRVSTIRIQHLGVQQQHASLSAKKMTIYPKPVLMKWDIAVGEAAFYEAHRLTRFHKRGPFDMGHVIV